MWGDLTVTLASGDVWVDLPPTLTTEAQRLRPLWHQVFPAPGSQVTAKSAQTQSVRLTVESDAPGWNPHWARWSYAVRRLTEDEGGQALAAQDMLAEDQAALTLQVRGGETRVARLEFSASLDGTTEPGDYPYRIVAVGTAPSGTDQSRAVRHGNLWLRHPACRLLDALPAVFSEPVPEPYGMGGYQEPPFFERFLRGFEDTVEEMREKLRHLERFFDADETPAAFLDWLATWVALALNENWPEMKRRRLIKEAVELYRWRGTRRGLSRYLEIYTDTVPQISDVPFAGLILGPGALLGRTTTLGGVRPHTFTVTLSVSDQDAVDPEIVDAIIEAQRPAHTAFARRIVTRQQTEGLAP